MTHLPLSPWRREWSLLSAGGTASPDYLRFALLKFVPFSVATVLLSLLAGWVSRNPEASTMCVIQTRYLQPSHALLPISDTRPHLFRSLTMKLEEGSLMEGNPAHSCPCKGTGPSGTWGHDRKILHRDIHPGN